MASITSTPEEEDSPNNTPPPPPHQPSPDEVAAMESLYKNTKATDKETTVAHWLLQEFTTHKARITKGSKDLHLHTMNIDKLVADFEENNTLPPFISQIKGPQAHPPSLTELQDLWDTNTTDFRKTCFQTLISYKTHKTSTLKTIIESDGDITRSLIASVKNQESIMLSSPDTPKSKHPSIKKEALACCIYWAKHRKEWVAAGQQIAQEEFITMEEKIKTLKTKQESKSYNTAVRNFTPNLSYFSKKFTTGQQQQRLPSQRQSTQSLGKSNQRTPLTSSKSCEVSSLLKISNPQYTGPPNESLLYTPYHEQQGHKRKRNQEGQRQGQRHIRRLPKHKTSSYKNSHMHKLLLEYKDNILSLQQFGIIQPEVHNISSQIIDPIHTNALALGHKFIPTPKLNHKIIKKNMKYFTRSTRLKWFFKDEEEAEKPLYWIPSEWQPPHDSHHPIIEKYLSKLEQNLHIMSGYYEPNIDRKQITNLSNLLERPDLIVITADKNLGYVITDTTWYEKTCLDHLLSDSYINVTDQYYINGLSHTTVNNIYQELCTKIIQYVENFTITPEEAKWICQKNDRDFSASSFYILPKIHKNPIKGRPIVPSMNWVTFHLSEWIANQLNPLVSQHCPDVLKDTTQLLNHISEINQNTEFNTSEYFILSADVEALYPNMDIQLGLTLMKDFLTEIDWADQNRRDLLLWAMNFTLTKGYIYFKGMIFQQTNGAAMGSPMIPPYANIFMHMVEKNITTKYSNHILLYKRFIDDVILIIKKDMTQIQNFQTDMNNIHPNIKLIWTPASLKVDFLDITIMLDLKISKIRTLTFQKPLNKYSYLPFKSYHTLSMKTGFIKGEAIRYVRTCSRKKDYNKMIKLFTIRLQRRGYPLHLINQTINQVNYKFRTQYLIQRAKQTKIPYIFKILHNPKVNHKILRYELNYFTDRITKAIPNLPHSLQQKITICYKLPSTLHRRVTKARKNKDY
jgi:hypothetical protein